MANTIASSELDFSSLLCSLKGQNYEDLQLVNATNWQVKVYDS